MRLKCIACEVFARPLYALAAESQNIIDIDLVEKAKHNWPSELRKIIQEKVLQTCPEKYQAILLAYGLCGKALAGIEATHLTLVLPRAHDCITLFLGSRERYRAEFEREPGTFWYIRDYVERSTTDELDGFGGPGLYDQSESLFQEYVEKYGEDNALFLMKEMSAWQSHYKRAVFIGTGIGDENETDLHAKKRAGQNNWSYKQLEGDLRLLKRLLDGDWDQDFLVVEPGQKVQMRADDEIIGISL
jgi:hypothetical protein